MVPPPPPDPKPTLGIPVVGVGDAAETLLSCRVPDLPRNCPGESRERNLPELGLLLWLPALLDHHAQPEVGFHLEVSSPLPKLTCNFTFTPSTATTLFCRRQGENIYQPKACLGACASQPWHRAGIPQPLSFSPRASGMKPGCPWGWTLKPHCCKP